MAKKGNRIQVILECTEHKTSGMPGMSRYITTKNKKNTTERLEVMAKKVVATLKSGKGKEFSKVIKMVKTDNGSYQFKEEVVHNDHVKDFLKNK